MRVFAVRHKPSGLFIPRLERGHRRGSSHLEPSNEREPRFFHNEFAARAFISNWLQGVFKNSSHTTYEGEEEPYLEIVKQPHRKKEEMEIVAFELVELRGFSNDNTRDSRPSSQQPSSGSVPPRLPKAT